MSYFTTLRIMRSFGLSSPVGHGTQLVVRKYDLTYSTRAMKKTLA